MMPDYARSYQGPSQSPHIADLTNPSESAIFHIDMKWRDTSGARFTIVRDRGVPACA
jgi:hypothetical protein